MRLKHLDWRSIVLCYNYEFQAGDQRKELTKGLIVYYTDTDCSIETINTNNKFIHIMVRRPFLNKNIAFIERYNRLPMTRERFLLSKPFSRR
jgi:hypothetical protein